MDIRVKVFLQRKNNSQPKWDSIFFFHSDVLLKAVPFYEKIIHVTSHITLLACYQIILECMFYSFVNERSQTAWEISNNKIVQATDVAWEFACFVTLFTSSSLSRRLFFSTNHAHSTQFGTIFVVIVTCLGRQFSITLLIHRKIIQNKLKIRAYCCKTCKQERQ